MDSLKKFGSVLALLCIAALASTQTLSYMKIADDLITVQKKLVPDKRIALLEIELTDTLQPLVVIRGETNLPEAKMQIIQFLKEKQIEFLDSIRLLPDLVVGDKTWALACISVSNLRAQPGDASELVSQAIMGTPMKVLDIKGNWIRVQTPDYYIGWMDKGELIRLTEQEMNHWKSSNRWLFNDITGIVTDKPGKKGKVVSDLVLDDLFEVEKTGNRFLKIRIPDGRTGYVRKKQCISFEDWSQSDPGAGEIISIAEKLTGFPYLWGGTSTKAVDCSGLVKVAFFSEGIIVARDASQQAMYGKPVDFTNLENLQSCDLIFFGRSPQRITHVGIYLANGDFINSSGKVHISSILKSDAKYNPARNNVAACRILGSVGKEGITRVKDHPWYN